MKNINSKAFAECPSIEDVYCYTVRYPSTNADAFQNSYPDYITLHVPANSVEQYKAIEPWSKFRAVVAITENDNPLGGEGTEKCAKPTISYKNGKLSFDCATQGAVCQTTITDADVSTFLGNEIQLSATYHISAYATKYGYQNSDVAIATLCWIDVEPRTEGMADGLYNVPAAPVLIQTEGNILSITGVPEGEVLRVYDTAGRQLATTIASGTTTQLSLPSSSLVIVKIGEKSVKVSRNKN